MADSAFPPVLALGAWLKNTACVLDGQGLRWSAMHGDLQDPAACDALEVSARALASAGARPLAGLAHDLHPDFFSTRLARALGAEWGLPVQGVQHHHAHIGAVMAEHGLVEPVIGLALDGVGLGTDGKAWGGELLWVTPSGWRRLGHLWPLALPGGDKAAREPWRMLASVLHALGRSAETVPRLSPVVGRGPAQMLGRMLDSGLNCPTTTSTGRWFDAAAAALGLHLLAQHEAEAAMALEQQARAFAATATLATLPALPMASELVVQEGPLSVLDLRPVLARLLDWPAGDGAVPAAAAWFHEALAEGLAHWAHAAAQQAGGSTVCLGGGCFLNQVLNEALGRRLRARGLHVHLPGQVSCGDAGLALGQAWVVAQQLRSSGMASFPFAVTESHV